MSKVPVQVRLPEALHATIAEYARVWNVSRNDAYILLLSRGLAETQQQPTPTLALAGRL